MVEFRLKDGSGKITLRYMVEDVDRHGNVRIYLRRKGHPKVRLMSTPGTPEFLAEYQAALGAGALRQPAKPKQRSEPAPGSLSWLAQRYYASGKFTTANPGTKKMRRSIIDRLCEQAGDAPVSTMQVEHVEALRDQRAATPAAANNMVKVLRQMFAWALKAKLVRLNPAVGIDPLPMNPDGHHTWTNEQVEQFEAHWPIGTNARLALALLLYTGQRRSDIIRMGPQHVKDGWMTITQTKNAGRNPVTVSVPVLPALQEIIDATPSWRGHLAFLISKWDKPYTVDGFGRVFREWCDKAELPAECSAHGLRKTAATRLAEMGATEHEIAAITGHRSLNEVARYTRKARQKELAARAGALMAEHGLNKSVPPISDQLKSGTKTPGK
ncbi:tyrosine-type recombinase/integrase [Azospirillum sp. B4]|uniref:tyrosine-type recombinase/integrase n=1 Tax=Azospirillum sp. B4 TaxID=95605 RepID=UPI0003479F32|nr:tyrosine-type recombinase/integrase [Azospirillum sp. B4]